ncbi:MAG: hypothetical protein ACC608_09465 [Anaerofustis sp.]
MRTKTVVCVDCGETSEIPEAAALQRMGKIEFYRCHKCRMKRKKEAKQIPKKESLHQQMSLLDAAGRR